MAKTLISKNIKHGFKALRRLGYTAKEIGVTGIRIANGEKMDAVLMRETFENLGTTYIKLGQFIASSPSLFPREFVDEFQKCLDKTPDLPFVYVDEVLTKELGSDYRKYFKHIDAKPLASASIAQVHSATLEDGTEVVLKIQKPDVATIINTDLSVVFASMKLAELVMPKLRFASLSIIVDEIKNRMVEEADFTKEAKNVLEFKDFLVKTGNNKVTAPYIYPELSTKKVLVMERFFGVSMTDPVQMKQYCANPVHVLTTMLNTWFASVMSCGSFHADLHAGNLMLLEDGRVGFIDFGIVGKLNPVSWQASIGFMQALQISDYENMAVHMLNMGMTSQKVDTKLLAQDLERTIKNMTGENNLSKVDNKTKSDVDELNQIMMDLVEVGDRHGIHFPRDFTLLIKQMLYFDRYMQIIAPEMDLFDTSQIQMLG